MPGFGSILGAFGQAYPQYQRQQADQARLLMEQQNQKMGQQKLQQALQQMALEQQQNRAAQEAQQAGLKQMSGTAPALPGGAYSQQQIAQFAQNNPQAFAAFMGLSKPAMQGSYNVLGRETSGQYGLDRAGITGDTARDVAGTRAGASNYAADSRLKGTEYRADHPPPRATGNPPGRPAAEKAPDILKDPEYRAITKDMGTLDSSMKRIEQDYAGTGNPTKYLQDPRWTDLSKQYTALKKQRDEFPAKFAAKQKQAAPAQKSVPLPQGAEQFPDGTEIPDETGATWIKQGNVLVPKG